MKKILFLLIAAIGLSFSSNNAWAQKTSKEEKKAIAEARKVVKSAKDELTTLGEKGKIENAKKYIDQAIKDPYTKDWSETWSVAGNVYKELYLNENKKTYTKAPYDTTAFYDYLSKMFDYFIICDSLEQIPNEKGKILTTCRDKNAADLNNKKTNFINGGVYYFNNKKDYKKAFELFSKYYEISEVPMLKPLTEQDPSYKENANQFAYFTTLAAMNMGDYKNVIKYSDLGVQDPEYGEICYQFRCQAYENMKDTANWIKSLNQGVIKYPTEEYYYKQLLVYYDQTNNMQELEKFVNDMVVQDPNKAYNYYVIGYLNYNQNKYSEAAKQFEIAIEKDENLIEAYINLGLCYIFLANEYVESKSNISYRSAEYKKVLEEEKKYYQKALPLFEKVRTAEPNETKKWGQPLYSIYYKLNMTKELSEIERILKAEGLLD